jgi:hypothetical protein
MSKPKTFNTKVVHDSEMKLLVEEILIRVVAKKLTKFSQKSFKRDTKLPFKYSTKPKTVHEN